MQIIINLREEDKVTMDILGKRATDSSVVYPSPGTDQVTLQNGEGERQYFDAGAAPKTFEEEQITAPSEETVLSGDLEHIDGGKAPQL